MEKTDAECTKADSKPSASHISMRSLDEQVFGEVIRLLRGHRRALSNLEISIRDRVSEASRLVASCSGKIVFTGLGKSGHVARLLASTYCSLGLPSVYLHPVEAHHGDRGMLSNSDLMIAVSSSGRTEEVLQTVRFAWKNGVSSVGILGRFASIAEAVDIALCTGFITETSYLDCIPTSSLISAISTGQAVGLSAAMRQGFTRSEFGRLHPGGEIGKRLH